VLAFARHYGTLFMPTKPYTPRHKGKVERGVDYVQENALRGRQFTSLDAQNHFLLDWEQTVADPRIHGTRRRQVGAHFAAVERPALQRLPLERFPCFQEARRIVHRDGHVEVERAFYSVPPEYMGHTVWARWDSVWFLRIAEHGYGGIQHGAAAAFYPLYPLTLAGLGRAFGGHYVAAGIVISLAAALASFLLLYRLAEERLGADGVTLIDPYRAREGPEAGFERSYERPI